MVSSYNTVALIATLLFSSTMGHSQMRCAKYNTATGACAAPIRNSAVSFLSEAHDMSNGPICQSPMTNPITASYANGAGCPDYAPCNEAMGTYTPGETFTVMWFARNHATADQTPGNISLYLSPPLSLTQGADVTLDQFRQNKFCTAPFTSCNGLNGNTVQCTTQCTMPSNTAAGIYTIWWKWAWPGHTQVYSTCADISVVAGSSNTPVQTPVSQPPSAPAPVPRPSPTPSPVVTPVPAPVVTPVPAPVQTPVTPVAPVSPVTPGTCSGNTMKCLSDNTYSMCNRGSWGSAQSCGPRSTCSPVGDYVYCVASSTPAATPVAPVTPTTPVVTPAPVPTPVATPTPAPLAAPKTGSCVSGSQVCYGDVQYQTCGNGRYGPEWAMPQPCISGLSCHASATANNIYCY